MHLYCRDNADDRAPGQAQVGVRCHAILELSYTPDAALTSMMLRVLGSSSVVLSTYSYPSFSQ